MPSTSGYSSSCHHPFRGSIPLCQVGAPFSGSLKFQKKLWLLSLMLDSHTTEPLWIFFWIIPLESEAKVWTEDTSLNVRRKITEIFDNLTSYSFCLFSSKHRERVIYSFLFALLCLEVLPSKLQEGLFHPKIKIKTKIKNPKEITAT